MNLNSCYLRILNAVPNYLAFDIYINDKIYVSSLSYKNFSDYFSLGAQNYNLKIYVSGNRTNLLLEKDIDLYAQKIYTLAIIGEYNLSSFNLDLIDDRLREVNKNFSYIRFINLSPTLTEADILLNNQFTISNLSYSTYSNYLELAPDIYDLKVYMSNLSQKNIILHNPNMKLDGNKIYSAYIVGTYRSNLNQTQILLPLEGATYLTFK